MNNSKNIECLLIDLDGVINITEKDGKYIWKETREKDLGIKGEIIDEFFINSWKPVVLGQISMEKQLSNHLKQYNLENRTSDIIQYFIEKNSNIDNKIFTFLQKIKLPLYLASDLNQERLDYYWNELKLKNLFKGKFISCELGVKKSKKEFFEKVVETTNIKPEKILFIDDDKKNTITAKECGLKAHFYKSYDNADNLIFKDLI